MRQVTRKGLITVAAAGGVLAMGSGAAFADSSAQGGSASSPGVLSGNTVEGPVNITVNICGNTVSAVGLLNPSSGNGCQNGGPADGSSEQKGGPGVQGSNGAHADGSASDSPGVGSGNNVKVPVDVPANACGNSLDVAGIGNSTAGNGCETPSDGDEGTPEQPGEPNRPTEPGNPHAPDEPGDSGSPERPQGPGAPETPGQPGQPAHPGSPEQPGSSGEVHGSSQPEAAQPQAVPASHADEERAELAQTGAGSPLGVLAPAGAGMLLGGYVLYRRSRAVARR